MKKEEQYSGDLMLEIEEIKNIDEKTDENVRASFSVGCSHFLTIICC